MELGAAIRKGDGIRREIKELSRERILEESRRLFFSLGYRGATMEVIADALDMGKPFLYRHFRNKLELLVALYDRAITLSDDALDRALAEDLGADATIRLFVRNYLEVVVNEREIVAIFFRESANVPADAMALIDERKRSFDRKLTAVVEAGVAEGLFQVSSPRLAAYAVIGMVNWSYQWYRGDRRLSPRELGDLFGEFALAVLKSGGGVAP